MNITEIFTSIEGEGSRSGLPCTFIRLHGCNLKCSYCDSQYACDGIQYHHMTIKEIVNNVKAAGVPRVTITGGEPLLDKEFYTLLDALLKETDVEINIETNGSILFDYNVLGSKKDPRIMITMDWKSITSGMSEKMQAMNLCYLTSKDVLKFVVGTKRDLEQMKAIVVGSDLECQVFVSPVFGITGYDDCVFPDQIVEFILENKLDVRMQLQIHKFIWDPNQRGV